MKLLFQKLNLDGFLKVFIPEGNVKFIIVNYSVPIHLNH
jgi:hypothetical protein